MRFKTHGLFSSAAPTVTPALTSSAASSSSSSKRPRLDQVSTANLDADDPIDEDDSDDSDSDGDDTAQLLAELQRIKKERASEQSRKVRASKMAWSSIGALFYSYNPVLKADTGNNLKLLLVHTQATVSKQKLHDCCSTV